MKGKKTGGKVKGSVNVVTTTAKELVLNAIDGQSLYFNDTMDRIRVMNPTEWAKIMVKLYDFVIPKKLDITSDGNKLEPVTIQVLPLNEK